MSQHFQIVGRLTLQAMGLKEVRLFSPATRMASTGFWMYAEFVQKTARLIFVKPIWLRTIPNTPPLRHGSLERFVLWPDTFGKE